ncbi:TetR/AcrR family transcriptional regulator [Phenylobacterium sp.]|uniref:TetR/AcrR family transcriptional regulator n=1 Tax=Phenylobacterium sp. TaxID=1871053 RepID=UPI00120032E0|nr:TetR/AcrR family transcriptional regulator [Phenylobacterium sp.]THD73204.1 MAG: TetR/AcrR family transcriptional regulator [Phenylobacterium sp.]
MTTVPSEPLTDDGTGGGALAPPPADANDGPPTARQTQKEATRARVLAAAKELFDNQGYEGTTIRGIAGRAGVSVGSVFTTFDSKGEILSQVMQDRLDGLYGELDRVMPHLRGSTLDRLRTMFAIYFAFESRHTRLFLAHIAATFDWTLPASARPMGKTPRVHEIVRECLTKGVAEGDVDPQVDPQEIVDLLLAAYVWTYRLAAWKGATAAEMTAVMDRQIELIAAGFTPG